MNSSLTDEEMIKKTDELLYKAKKQGKNRMIGSIIIDKSIHAVDLV